MNYKLIYDYETFRFYVIRTHNDGTTQQSQLFDLKQQAMLAINNEMLLFEDAEPENPHLPCNF